MGNLANCNLLTCVDVL